MLGQSWIALLGRIPAQLHDSLSLTLVTGSEIVVQSLFRLESDFVILRGRMAGSTDAGRVIVLPYDQIVNLAFTKRMLEPEVEAIFGKSMEAGAQPAAQMNGAPNGAPNGAELEGTASTAASVTPGANEPGPMEATSESLRQATAAQLSTTLKAPPQVQPQAQPQAPVGAEKDKTKLSKSVLLARLRARLAEHGK